MASNLVTDKRKGITMIKGSQKRQISLCEHLFNDFKKNELASKIMNGQSLSPLATLLSLFDGCIFLVLSPINTKNNNFKKKERAMLSKYTSHNTAVKVSMVDRNNNLVKTFDTIEEASRYANVSGWKMSLKMQTFGFYEDEYGNKYYRLSPMKKRKRRVKVTNIVKREEPKNTFVPQKTEQKIEVKIDADDPVISILNKEIIRILKEANVYEKVKKLSDAIKLLSTKGE